MEPEVVEDDFQRFRKENEEKWQMIDESLEKCLKIDSQGESVSFQVNYRRFFRVESLSCYESHRNEFIRFKSVDFLFIKRHVPDLE